MITKYDEFLCHQVVSTFDSVGTSAREWTERVWVSVHDTTGQCHFAAGFGVYPNRNIIDTFACFAVEGRTQYNVRASRELHPRTDDVAVGPFSYEVIEPLKKLRLTLEENEHGLSYEIDFEASMQAHEEDAQYSMARGRTIENVKRYVQVGRPSGWIKADGETYQIDRNSWRAERDHSWGVRQGGGVAETGVQPREIPDGYVYNFILTQFDDWGAAYHIRENGDGKASHFCGGVSYPVASDKEVLDVTGVEHNFTFRSDIRQVNGGEVTLQLEDGSSRELSFRPLSVNYIKAGGYFGFRGFTHGEWLGEYFMDSVELDLTDPEVIQELSFLDDVMCEIRCNDEIGYGIVEMVVVGRYPRYGY
jgi:hypothetical protein